MSRLALQEGYRASWVRHCRSVRAECIRRGDVWEARGCTRGAVAPDGRRRWLVQAGVPCPFCRWLFTGSNPAVYRAVHAARRASR